MELNNFYRQKNITPPNYTIQENNMKIVQTGKDLRILMAEKLSFNDIINSIAQKRWVSLWEIVDILLTQAHWFLCTMFSLTVGYVMNLLYGI